MNPPSIRPLKSIIGRFRSEVAIVLLGLSILLGVLYWADQQVRAPFKFASATLVPTTVQIEQGVATKVINLGYAEVAVPTDFPEDLQRAEDSPFIGVGTESGQSSGFFGAPVSTREGELYSVIQSASILLLEDQTLSLHELQARALEAQPFGLLERVVHGKTWAEQQKLLLGMKRLFFALADRVELLQGDDVDVVIDYHSTRFYISALHRSSGLSLHFSGKPQSGNPRELASAFIQHIKPLPGWNQPELIPDLIVSAGIPVHESSPRQTTEAVPPENRLQAIRDEVLRRRDLRAKADSTDATP